MRDEIQHSSINLENLPRVLFSRLEYERVRAIRHGGIAGVAAVENLSDGRSCVGSHVESGRRVHLDRLVNHFGESTKQEARVIAEMRYILILIGRFLGL